MRGAGAYSAAALDFTSSSQHCERRNYCLARLSCYRLAMSCAASCSAGFMSYHRRIMSGAIPKCGRPRRAAARAVNIEKLNNLTRAEENAKASTMACWHFALRAMPKISSASCGLAARKASSNAARLYMYGSSGPAGGSTNASRERKAPNIIAPRPAGEQRGHSMSRHHAVGLASTWRL